MDPVDVEILESATRWVIDYLDGARSRPVLAQVAPGAVAGQLPLEPPEAGAGWPEIERTLDTLLLPAMTHWNHPRFFGYFATSSPPAAIAGELVAAATNQNAMLWRTSPAACELEDVVARWVRSLLGLPPTFGLIHDTASTSTFSALAAARARAHPAVTADGLTGAPPLVIYTSDQAHSSVDKAAIALGLGRRAVSRLPADRHGRLAPAALRAEIAADRERGSLPMAIVATVGTTAATASDPVDELASIAEEEGVWLHVDAAYGGAAAISPRRRHVLQGAERADSLVVNPHKWLFVPLDLSLLYLKDPEATRAAFSLVPDYLATDEPVVNPMDYGLALGRRWRSLKLWMLLVRLGRQGVVQLIEEHLRLAELLAGWVSSAPELELAAPVDFGVVNFRWRPPSSSGIRLDDAPRRLADAINATGEAFVTTAVVGSCPAVHVAIGNVATSEADVRRLFELITEATASLGRTPRDSSPGSLPREASRRRDRPAATSDRLPGRGPTVPRLREVADAAARATGRPPHRDDDRWPGPEDGAWPAAKELWSLDPAFFHLNHGSYGAVPRLVRLEQDRLRSEMAADPVGWFRHRLLPGLAEARRAIGGFFGVGADDISLVTNATTGVATVLASLRLAPGDELLTTDHAYGAVRTALERAAVRHGARVVATPVPPGAADEEVVDAIGRHLRPTTRLLVVDAITSSTARRFPIEQLAAVGHAHGVPLLVDGAHAPGQLSIDLSAAQADYWVGNLHKWPAAPTGTAVLWAAPPHRATLRTLVPSWGESLGFPGAFDHVGTADLTSWLTAPLALDLLDQLGWDRLRAYAHALAVEAQALVADAIRVAPSALWTESELWMQVVPLPKGVAATDESARALQDRITHDLRTYVAVSAWNGRGLLRISAHGYTTRRDVEALAAGLGDILA